ncbi:MAG TPA: hypothetical protein VKK79_08980, partial [Candidatus Lokiarchaeia archaeon]|nr:hypothetical protein [Candidatus Lokiarchaeia archaeon]
RKAKKTGDKEKPARGEEGETVEVGEDAAPARVRVSRPIPPALRDTATMLVEAEKPRGKKIAVKVANETKEEEVEETRGIDPSQINIHTEYEMEIPEEYQAYQRGCVLKVRKVGNSRFSQEMTRYGNQRFIKKLGRGQYFIPDYFILAEIQSWAEKWETTLLLTPVSDEVRDIHMQDIRSKMSATGEDLPKKVQELERSLKMRDDQLIKMQMTSGEEKASLQEEIENLHNQLDQEEKKMDEMQVQMDDSEVGTGAAEIVQLKDRVESLESERADFERLYMDARDKIGRLQSELEVARSLGPSGSPQAGQPSPAGSEATRSPPPFPTNPLENISEEDAAELGDLSDLLVKGNEEDEEAEPDEEDLKAAMAYKKPKWDDDNDVVVVENEDDNVEMSDEELEQYERELKERESQLSDDEDQEDE